MILRLPLLVGLLVLAASHAFAEPSTPRPPLSGFIAHGSYMVRVGETKKYLDPGPFEDPEIVDRGILLTEIGGMARSGEKWGSGLSIFMGGNRDLFLLGLKARVRRMVGTTAYIDVAPGYVGETPQDAFTPVATGFVAEVTYMNRRWIGVTAQVQSGKRKDATGRSSTELWWYVGPKIAGTPGIFAAVSAILIVCVMELKSTN